MKLIKSTIGILFTFLSINAFAQDITGIWQQIDDKSGSAKAIIEIRQEPNEKYVGKVIKITPRLGYKPKEYCNNCSGAYSNRPILGMDILKGLNYIGDNIYSNGKIIDPLTGTIYDAKIKVSESGRRLTLRAFMGVYSLGRTQTWLRIE
jgi:uncharacterized protein (DUF2147 family)